MTATGFQDVHDIYKRGADTVPREYIIRWQDSEPERVERLKRQAAERRERRNQKRRNDATRM